MKGWKIAISSLGASVLLLVPALTFASIHFDAFLVADGMGYRPGSVYRYRSCVGVTWEPHEVRDGEDRRCIGMPVGPWRCYAVVYDAPYVRIPC